MKVDFVLGSGFCKGSFQYGVLKGIKANRNVELRTNNVYGVSVGGLHPLDSCMDCPTLGCGKESDLVIAINLDLNHVKCRHEDNPKVKNILIPQEFHEQSICSKETMLQMIDCGYEIRKFFL